MAGYDRAELLDRAQACTWERSRMQIRLAGGTIVEEEGLLFCAASARVPWLNGVTVRLMPDDWEAVIERGAEFFQARGLAWGVSASGRAGDRLAAAAADLGLALAYREPGMLLAPLDVRRVEPPGLTVETVRDESRLADFQTASAAGFERPREAWTLMFPPAALDYPDLALYVGYVDGRPVASALRLCAYRVTLVGGVGTAPPYRRRGIGEAMTARAVLDGRDEGCIAAYLQATELGAPVYRRMGFVAITNHGRWLPAASIAERRPG